MKKSLLVCIAFHYNPDRVQYLTKVLSSFINEYECTKHIIIDTNVESLPPECTLNNHPDIEVVSHTSMEHPFHTTWFHRGHMKRNIDNYENFFYLEDDMYVPYKNYLNYLDNFRLLWPNHVPSFVRIEEFNGDRYITDATERQHANPVQICGKWFCNLKNPYHAFWIMPQKELKETLIEDFIRTSDSRVTAASYPMWELNKEPVVELQFEKLVASRELAASFLMWGLIKKPLVQMDRHSISELCYSFHLPNNYANCPDSIHGKIKPENIFL